MSAADSDEDVIFVTEHEEDAAAIAVGVLYSSGLAVVPEDIKAQAAGLERIDGGWRVKTSDDGKHYIDLFRMLYNWRIGETPVDFPSVIDRSWCYFGHGHDEDGNPRSMVTAFGTALAAALLWNGDPDTEPQLYDRAVGS